MASQCLSPPERQILTLLRGIKEISEDVKTLIKEMEAVETYTIRKNRISISILDHLERLANLDVLQSAHLSSGEGREIVTLIHNSMIDVHNCLARTTAAIVIDQVALVRDQALTTICSGHCQLGISHHFSETLDNIDLVIQTLGIDEHLSESDRVLLVETRTSVTRLATIEAESWGLPVFPN